jgi:RNA polymerase sigma-70 factor (ECF subfamily)
MRVTGGRAGTAYMTWPPDLPFGRVLERARALDQQAVAALYKRFLPTVYRFTLARVGDVHAAEDVTADTFFAMIESITTTRATDELAFAAWLLGIARNKVLLHFRHQRSQPDTQGELPEELEPADTAERDDPLRIVTARESWAEVAQALDRLTEDQRTVVLYRCVLGYSAEEVGHLMGKQAGTVRALQFRALASLARLLGIEGQTTTGHGAALPLRRGERRSGDATHR